MPDRPVRNRHVPDRSAPDRLAADGPAADRSDPERESDRDQIGRLAEDLLPTLVAKLGASGLAEIEIREGDWKVRVRRPLGALDRTPARRATDRPSRPQPGHSGHGHAPAA